MPGALTTKTLKDASGAEFTQRVWDESGTGAGPFQPVMVVAGPDGVAVAPAKESGGVLDDIESKLSADPATATKQDEQSTLLGSVIAGLAAVVSVIQGTLTVALSAGAAIIGRVGIDQTTPGTTNKVVADISAVAGREYETVAAGQTDQTIGATGAAGDDLDGLLIVPATTSPGAVSIKDGAGGAITVFTGGTDSLSNLVPFFVPLGLRSAAGAWKVTTGANVSVIAVGNFT